MKSINRKSRSILDEINAFLPNREKADIVEARAQHIISSATNLFETIDLSFSPKDAENLKNRFLSSIKNLDGSRFTRAVSKFKDSNSD